MTIIYVTHYLEEVKELFDKSLLLKRCRVFKEGNTKEIFTSKLFSDFLEQSVVLKLDDENNMRIKL